MEQTADDTRPLVAFLAPAPAPYRARFYDRVVRDLPQYRFEALFERDSCPDVDWSDDRPHEMKHRMLGYERQGRLRRLLDHGKRAATVEAILNELRPDLLVVNTLVGPVTHAGWQWARRHRAPYFIRTDSNFFGEMNKPLWNRLAKRILRRRGIADAAGALTLGSLNEAYFAYYGMDPDRFFRVPFLIDAERFARLAAEERQSGAVRSKLGIDARQVIFFVGRLIPRKAVTELLEAFLLLRQELPDTALLIVGDGELTPALKARSGDLLGKRVFLPGFLQPDEVAACPGLADIAVAASTEEPWGLVVEEAMSAGVPVITTRHVGAALELIETGHNGFLIPRHDTGSLAEALRACLTGPRTLAQLAVNARRRYEEWITMHDPIREFGRALDQALNSRAGCRAR